MSSMRFVSKIRKTPKAMTTIISLLLQLVMRRSKACEKALRFCRRVLESCPRFPKRTTLKVNTIKSRQLFNIDLLYLFEIKDRTPKPSQSESQKQQEMTFGLFTIISLSRIIANIYKDLIKCKRNKKQNYRDVISFLFGLVIFY